MDNEQFLNAQLLKKSFAELGFSADDLCVKRFMIYMESLLDWNNKINLTAITEPDEIILKHFADSLPVLKAIGEFSGNIVDIGTGAGFPGVPLKIMLPESKVLLLDSLNKRIVFLRELISLLKLSDINCVHARAEELGHINTYREKFDVAVSRAVADLSILVEYCLPFVRIGGKFISMKGPDTNEELLRAESAILTLGGNISEIIRYKIPFSDITHSLIIISKISETPPAFPRKSNKILKSPIR